MADLNLTALDELIRARTVLHGGARGAPIKLTDGSREGSAINKACVVIISAALQAFVEDVYVAASHRAFGRVLPADEMKRYKKTWDRWGNPSDDNIVNLFRRLGVDDVFDGLGWQKQNTSALKLNFKKLNEVRNDIAHGTPLMFGGNPFSLTKSQVMRWRGVFFQFGQRFEAHALSKVRPAAAP